MRRLARTVPVVCSSVMLCQLRCTVVQVPASVLSWVGRGRGLWTWRYDAGRIPHFAAAQGHSAAAQGHFAAAEGHFVAASLGGAFKNVYLTNNQGPQGPFRSLASVSTANKTRANHQSSKATAKESGEQNPVTGPTKTVKIFCAKCENIIYKYRKGGNGALVKCFVERIAEDYTNGDMKCRHCSTEFARLRMIKGKLAHKIIGGKVFMRK